MTRVCIFCGGREGNQAEIRDLVKELTIALVHRGIEIVYGGGHCGLMGIVADAALEQNGKVIGVIPDALVEREQAHERVSQLIRTKDMHERKAKMYELADAFIALPGGVGTMDEFFEVLTWKQIGVMDKPILLFDAKGYFQPLLAAFAQMVQSGFTDAEVFAQVKVHGRIEAILGELGLNN